MVSAPTVELSSSTGWLAVGVVGAAAIAAALADGAVSGGYVVWWVLYAAYALAFWLSDPRPGLWSRVSPAMALGVLVVTGIGLLVVDPTLGWTSVLLVVTAVVAALAYDRAVVVAVIVVQTLGISVAAASSGQSTVSVVITTLVQGTFQAFAAIIVRVARREAAARAALADAHAELQAATRLLELSSRNAERLRISRDLHDALGHKLTALALALEVAQHQTVGPAREQVNRARAITKDVLADVRETVSALRETSTALGPALREVVEGLPGLDVDLTVDESVPLGAEQSLAVVRCVQELATNAVRHGHARRLRVAVSNDQQGLRVTAEDDGQGAREVRPGNGLTGMRERFDDLGGAVEFASSPGAGFRVRVQVPQ